MFDLHKNNFQWIFEISKKLTFELFKFNVVKNLKSIKKYYLQIE